MRVAVILAAFLLACGTAFAAPDPAGSPDPAVTPSAAPASDVTADVDPTSRIKTLTFQGTYTGATYGPGNFRATQIIPRVAAFYLGKSLLRLSLPRLQTINGVDSGFSDTQLFYLFARPVRRGAKFVGFSAQFPTATSPLFGTGKWLLGPAGAYIFAYEPRSLIAGFLLQTAFTVAGAANRPNQSIITFLPIGALRIGQGWYLKYPEAPWIFDLQRGAGLIPLGLGVGRVAKIDGDPLLIAISDETSVLHANVINAPKNTVRLTFTVLVRSQDGRR